MYFSPSISVFIQRILLPDWRYRSLFSHNFLRIPCTRVILNLHCDRNHESTTERAGRGTCREQKTTRLRWISKTAGRRTAGRTNGAGGAGVTGEVGSGQEESERTQGEGAAQNSVCGDDGRAAADRG